MPASPPGERCVASRVDAEDPRAVLNARVDGLRGARPDGRLCSGTQSVAFRENVRCLTGEPGARFDQRALGGGSGTLSVSGPSLLETPSQQLGKRVQSRPRGPCADSECHTGLSWDTVVITEYAIICKNMLLSVKYNVTLLCDMYAFCKMDTAVIYVRNILCIIYYIRYIVYCIVYAYMLHNYNVYYFYRHIDNSESLCLSP